MSQALCDQDNRIWVLCGQKIWRSDTDQWNFKETAFDTVALGQPLVVFQLRGQPFCVITKKGFYNWNEKTEGFQPFHTTIPLPTFTPAYNRIDTCVTTVFYPGKDCFIAADLATGKLKKIARTKPYFTLCALTPDLAVVSYYDGNSFWLDFSNGTSMPMDAVQYQLSDHLHRVNLMDAEPLDDSLYMVTTQFGACTYDLRTNRFVKHRIFSEGKPIGLAEALVRVFRDKNGTFWAHNSSNIIAFNSIRTSIGLLRNFSDDPAQRWSNRVIGFTEDKAGNVWFGGFNGFNKLDVKTGQVEIHPPGDENPDRLSHISVRGMANDGHYIILGPTLKGMWLYEPLTDRFRRPHFAHDSVRVKMDQEFVHGIYPLRDGNFFVCGRSQAYLLHRKSYLLECLQFPGSHGNIQTACQDALDRIWIATKNGITVLDREYRYLFKISTGKEQVVSIFQRSENEMLFGTSTGLRRFSPASEQGKWLKVEGPLENVSTILIHRDSLQRFWFGTDHGLYLMDNQLKTFRHFDFADNIQSAVYYPFAKLQASNGMLFLGGRNGINYFYPEQIALEALPLVVDLQSLFIGNGDSVIWNPGKDLVFEAGQNTLTIEVVVPYYNNAGKLQYRYRLGQNNPWINTGGSHRIRLTDLAPGNYQLEVAASVEGGLWYAAEPLEFRIRPEFWQYPAFKAGMALLLLGLVYYVFRRRENLLKKRQQQSLELEKHKTTALQYELEAAEAKLQSLRLQMNPHFLFNALNSIQELIVTGNTDGAAMYLSKFSKLLRMILLHSDHESLTLREEIGILELYLELESLRFYDTFEYHIDCEPGLDQDEYTLPTLLIQPFVENAIWHGLLHKEGKRRLLVRFDTDTNDNLICTIEDNGIGRAAALKINSIGGHTGKGLSSSAERLQVLNSRHGQNNALEIIDLVSDDGVATGTCVRITIS
ncbi:MAG: histidine kinase [Saprospiraceae bacterium]|nr:histidine kinase [Saprospiraceae bacterium]